MTTNFEQYRTPEEPQHQVAEDFRSASDTMAQAWRTMGQDFNSAVDGMLQESADEDLARHLDAARDIETQSINIDNLGHLRTGHYDVYLEAIERTRAINKSRLYAKRESFEQELRDEYRPSLRKIVNQGLAKLTPRKPNPVVEPSPPDRDR